MESCTDGIPAVSLVGAKLERFGSAQRISEEQRRRLQIRKTATNAEQRTHPNVCGAPNATFDVLKKRSNIANLYSTRSYFRCSPLANRCSRELRQLIFIGSKQTSDLPMSEQKEDTMVKKKKAKKAKK